MGAWSRQPESEGLRRSQGALLPSFWKAHRAGSFEGSTACSPGGCRTQSLYCTSRDRQTWPDKASETLGTKLTGYAIAWPAPPMQWRSPAPGCLCVCVPSAREDGSTDSCTQQWSSYRCSPGWLGVDASRSGLQVQRNSEKHCGRGSLCVLYASVQPRPWSKSPADCPATWTVSSDPGLLLTTPSFGPACRRRWSCPAQCGRGCQAWSPKPSAC